MFLFRLADRLHMRVSELEDWPESELLEWSIYLQIAGEPNT